MSIFKGIEAVRTSNRAPFISPAKFIYEINRLREGVGGVQKMPYFAADLNVLHVYYATGVPPLRTGGTCTYYQDLKFPEKALVRVKTFLVAATMANLGIDEKEATSLITEESSEIACGVDQPYAGTLGVCECYEYLNKNQKKTLGFNWSVPAEADLAVLQANAA